MITVTLVRHGESIDNVNHIVAGWKDAPLSQHGMNQARAIGEYFAAPSTRLEIHHIYTSPLLRAHNTAEQIQIHQLMMDPTGPKPPLVQSDLLREQHFGDVEGKRYFFPPTSTTETNSSSSFPSEERGKRKMRLPDRQTCFLNGESSEDVGRRVDVFISKFIIPHVLESSSPFPPNDDNDVNTQQQQKPLNIVIVSHGIAISELIGALFRRGSQATRSACAPESWRGLVNTAWTRLTVSLLQDNTSQPSEEQSTQYNNEEMIDTGAIASEVSHPPPIDSTYKADPQLCVYATAVNQRSHLDNIVRQKGGIGSSAHDPKQPSIKEFFGSGSNIQ